MNWMDQNCLVHYTKTPDSVRSILQHGFILFPNPRGLINLLLSTDGFKQREPQQFGMVSFTEIPFEYAGVHSEHFGEYGIMVSWEWAQKHAAQRVIYIGEGPVLSAMQWMFQRAKQELEVNCPGPLGEPILRNKVLAGLYGQLYHHLLTVYEYMENERNSSQAEWRIVNPIPYHHETLDRIKLLPKLLKLARQGIGTVRIPPQDVRAVVCPKSKVKKVQKSLPAEYQGIPVLPVERSIGARLAIGLCVTGLDWFRRWRTRASTACVSNVEPHLRKESNGAWSLPKVAKLGGISVNKNDVLDRAECVIQFTSTTNEYYDLSMSFEDMVMLARYLNEAVHDPRMAELLLLAAQRRKVRTGKETK